MIVADEDWETLQETERRGYVNIRYNVNIKRMKATELFIKRIEDYLKKEADAGYYHSRRHMSTRFDEENVSSECRACNRFSADHLIGYRENLIRKIGTQRFQMLEVKAHQTKK